MSETEKKINGSLFGGYNKKSTEAYIEELQTMITKLQKDLASANEMNEKYTQKLKEAESYYRALWDRSKEQEAQIERQKSELRTNENVIKVQKETIRTRGDAARKQENLLRENRETIRLQQEDILNMERECQISDEKIHELEERLEEKDELIQEKDELVAKLKDKVEKQQWLYEQFFENKERVPISKVEQFVQDRVKRMVRRKR